jgi:hypothetical protein
LLLLATGNWRLATALETEQGKWPRQNKEMCTQVVHVEALDVLGDNLVIPPGGSGSETDPRKSARSAVKFLPLLLLATGNWRLATAHETEQGKRQNRTGECALKLFMLRHLMF